MDCSRVFPFLAIALCLVVCLLASADYKADGRKAREDAEVIVDEVLKKAKGDIANAKGLLLNADKMKLNAEGVEAKVKEAANINVEVHEIAEKASDALKTLQEEYEKAVKVGNELISHREAELKKAEKLDARLGLSRLVLMSDEGSYLSLKENADAAKREAQKLKESMDNESEPINNLRSSLATMKKLENETILAKDHVDAIFNAARMVSLLKSAEQTVAQIEIKKNEMSVTIGKVKELKETNSKHLTKNIGGMYESAETSFSTVSSEYEKAKQTVKEMQNLKTKINTELKKAKEETTFETRLRNVNSAKSSFSEFETKVEELKKVLALVTRHAENAKQNKVNALSEIEKNKDKHTVEFATKRVTSSEKEMPHLTSSSQQLIHKDSHTSITKTTGEPKHEHAVQSKVEVPNILQSGKSDGEQVATSSQPKKIKPQQSVADTVKQHAQGVTKVKVIKEAVLAGNLLGHGAELGDTAVTVSVSLVLALIACAAMH